MQNLTSLALLWLLIPATSFAIDVPLTAGQSPAQVFDALKDALGMKHRFLDIDSNVMRPWEVPGNEIKFRLPEDVSRDDLDQLRQHVEALRAGEPVKETLAHDAKPRRADLSSATVVIVEPKRIAGETKLKIIDESDAFNSRFTVVPTRPMTPVQIAKVLAKKFPAMHHQDVVTIRTVVTSELSRRGQPADPSEIEKMVKLVQIDLATGNFEMMEPHLMAGGPDPGGPAPTTALAPPPVRAQALRAPTDQTARVERLRAELAKPFIGEPSVSEIMKRFAEEVYGSGGPKIAPPVAPVPKSRLLRLSHPSAVAKSSVTSLPCTDFEPFGGDCDLGQFVQIYQPARQVLLDAAMVMFDKHGAPHDETEQFSKEALYTVRQANQVVVECEPRWSVANCVEHTLRKMTEARVGFASMHPMIYVDDTAVAPADRPTFDHALVRGIRDAARAMDQRPKTLVVRSHDEKRYDDTVYGPYCSRSLK